MKKIIFALLIFAFFLLELILWLNKVAGFLVYVIIVGLILISLEKDRELSHSEKLLIFLVIVPIARITEFFINFSFFWDIIVFYAVILFLVVFYSVKFKINLGFRKEYIRYLILTVLGGAFLGYVVSNYFSFSKSFELIWILPLIAFSEEALFRGMIQNYSKKDYGASFSILSTAFLFSIFSLSFGLKFFCFMFLLNLVMCSIYNKTENLWLTIPINFFINFLLFVV